MPERQRTDREVRNLARWAVRMGDSEVVTVLAWNAAHPDQKPRDCEYWRCARHYAKKLLRAHRAGKPIKQLWVEALFECGDALPEY